LTLRPYLNIYIYLSLAFSLALSLTSRPPPPPPPHPRQTRLEVSAEKQNTVAAGGFEPGSGADPFALPGMLPLPNGVPGVYRDLVVGGGDPALPGRLVLVHFRGEWSPNPDAVGAAGAAGAGPAPTWTTFEDTRARGKPLVFVFGKRPLVGGLSPGAEAALSTMRSGGGRRAVVVPAEGGGFGLGQGYALQATRHAGDKEGSVPPGASLRYDIELIRSSVAPS